MGKKTIFGFVLGVLLVLAGGFAYASAFDVSIDRVRVNGNSVSYSATNLLDDANTFSVVVDYTAVLALDNAHVEATLRGRQSGNSVSDSTSTFNLAKNQKGSSTLTLSLIDRMKSENDFDLAVKIVDAQGSIEQRNFGIRTKQTISGRALDVSVDRVIVNGQIVADSGTNFIDEKDSFDVVVEFTALEAVEDARVDAVLKDLDTGLVVSDASPNFDINEDASSSKSLKLNLIDSLKRSDSFELTIKIMDAEGDFVQKVFRMSMRGTSGIVADGGLDLSINSVEVERKVVAENENNYIIISDSKKDLGIKVSMTSLEDLSNARIEAVLTFENGDSVADVTSTFNINDGATVTKQLELPLPGRFEQDSFNLRIRIVDEEGREKTASYGVRISTQKLPFVLGSIILSPDGSLDAGKNLEVKLNLRNSGIMPLEGVVATVSIPELGISSSKFLDQIANRNKESATADFLLKTKDDVITGTYTVRAEIVSQFESEREVKETQIFIIGKNDQTRQLAGDKLVITIPILEQDMSNDGSESIYPIILENKGQDVKTYTLLFDGDDWADLRISGSNVLILKPGESRTVNVYASAKGAALGEHVIMATIKSDGNILKEIAFKANVADPNGSMYAYSSLKSFLKYSLIVFAFALAAVGLFFGARNYMEGDAKGKEERAADSSEVEPYY